MRSTRFVIPIQPNACWRMFRAKGIGMSQVLRSDEQGNIHRNSSRYIRVSYRSCRDSRNQFQGADLWQLLDEIYLPTPFHAETAASNHAACFKECKSGRMPAAGI